MKRKTRSDAASPRVPRRRRDDSARSPSPAADSDASAEDAAAPAPAQAAPSGRGHAVVSRERALYFATGQRAPAPAAAAAEEGQESWPGYFATARALDDNRLAAQAARKQRQQGAQAEQEKPKIVWTPKRPARASVLTADHKVKRLRDLALLTLAEHVEQLPTLEYIDATARHQVARAVVKLRRLKPEVLPLFIFPGVTEIDIPDCSNIDEDTLIRALKECTAHGLDLTTLRLGLCGRCVSDSVIDELGDSLKAVEQLQVQGCYRLSDAGCEALVRRCAPSLDSFEISCNQRITKKSIDYFCELQNLHSLTLSECPQIDDASLESLKSMKNLRKLQLNQMERLSDEFICSLAKSLPELEEFSIARCSQLTNVAVVGILDACRGLKVLDVSDLHQITDECFEPVRTHGHALSRVSMRCCLGLTDVALQHIAFGANSYLETLQMSSVSQATDATIMALQEHCATSLATLDISFCRNISEDALGVLADGTESLRSLVLWGCTQGFLEKFGAQGNLRYKAMMELRHAPYNRKKSPRKSKAKTVTTDRPRNNSSKWTSDEDALLRDGVCELGGKKWSAIAERIAERSPDDCSKRWNKLQSLDTVVKRPWTAVEDGQMLELVARYGPSKWAVIASYLKDRNGKQCRERWHNQLNPAIKKTPWTEDEDDTIMRLQAQFGNSWAKITAHLPGRTDNAVKNHWYSSLQASARRVRADGLPLSRKKPKKKSRKAKACARKKEAAAVLPVSTTAAGSLQIDEAGENSVDQLAFIAPESTVDVGFFDAPSATTAAQSGSLSPDSVSDRLDTYVQSYKDGVLRAQAVIDNVLDPMGMGSISDKNCSSWRSDPYCCYPTSDTGNPSPVDPTSPAQPPFGLDELLYDSLYDVCGSDGLQTPTTSPESSGWVLSTPTGEVARVYHQQELRELGICTSPPVPTTSSSFVPTAAYAQPDLLPLEQTELVSEKLTLDDVKQEMPPVQYCFTVEEGSNWAAFAPQFGLEV